MLRIVLLTVCFALALAIPGKDNYPKGGYYPKQYGYGGSHYGLFGNRGRFNNFRGGLFNGRGLFRGPYSNGYGYQNSQYGYYPRLPYTYGNNPYSVNGVYNQFGNGYFGGDDSQYLYGGRHYYPGRRGYGYGRKSVY